MALHGTPQQNAAMTCSNLPLDVAGRINSVGKPEMCQQLVIKSLELAQMRESQVRCYVFVLTSFDACFAGQYSR